MGKQTIVTNEKLPGYWYEIGLLTKTDGANKQLKFRSDLALTDTDIKTKLETITDCYVESVKRVTKYQRTKVSTPDEYGVVITGRYTLNGVKVRTDSTFLPLVKKAYVEYQTLENELKEFFGQDFEIDVYSPRL